MALFYIVQKYGISSNMISLLSNVLMHYWMCQNPIVGLEVVTLNWEYYQVKCVLEANCTILEQLSPDTSVSCLKLLKVSNCQYVIQAFCPCNSTVKLFCSWALQTRKTLGKVFLSSSQNMYKRMRARGIKEHISTHHWIWSLERGVQNHVPRGTRCLQERREAKSAKTIVRLSSFSENLF